MWHYTVITQRFCILIAILSVNIYSSYGFLATLKIIFTLNHTSNESDYRDEHRTLNGTWNTLRTEDNRFLCMISFSNREYSIVGCPAIFIILPLADAIATVMYYVYIEIVLLFAHHQISKPLFEILI